MSLAVTVVNPLPSDWEKLRPFIEDLYIDKGWPLAEVMATAEKTYNFKASKQMYKRRLAKWSLRKNCRQSDMDTLNPFLVQHGGLDKLNHTSIARPDAWRAKLLSYAKRKGVLYIPVPVISGCIINQAATSHPEHLAGVLHAFLGSQTFDDPTKVAVWKRSSSNTDVLGIFDDIVLATKTFLAGHYKENIHHLSCFFNGAKRILQAYPALVTRDILAMVLFLRPVMPDAIRLITAYFRDLSVILFGRTHPLATILSWISNNCYHMTSSLVNIATAATMTRVLREYCLRNVGPDHMDTADCDILLASWQADSARALTDLLEIYDHSYGLGSYHSLHCLGYLQRTIINHDNWSGFRNAVANLATRSAFLSAAGKHRLIHYVQSCQATLQSSGHGGGSIRSEIERLFMSQYNTLAADEWKGNK